VLSVAALVLERDPEPNSEAHHRAVLDGHVLSGKTNVTTKVTAGTYKTGKLAAGASQVLQLQIAVSSKATAGKIDTCAVTASSNHAPTRKDVVKAKVKVG
jgi:GTPase